MLFRFAPRIRVWAQTRRQLSTGPSSTKDKAVVFESTSRDPYFNLALEDWWVLEPLLLLAARRQVIELTVLV